MKTFFKYFRLVVANFFSALVFSLLMKPCNIAGGGTGGLALIVNRIIDVDVNLIIYIVYIITFVLSAFLLGKNSLLGILISSVCYPLFVSLTSNFNLFIDINYSDIFMISVIGGVVNGACNGFIYKDGFASSGIGTIAPILHKYMKVSISLTNFIISCIIVILGGVYFGVDKVLLAIVYLYLNNIVSNKIILGVSFNKSLFIKSDNYEMIAKKLYELYKIEPIIFKHNNILLITIPVYEYDNIKKVLYNLDNNVSFVTNDTYEVS